MALLCEELPSNFFQLCKYMNILQLCTDKNFFFLFLQLFFCFVLKRSLKMQAIHIDLTWSEYSMRIGLCSKLFTPLYSREGWKIIVSTSLSISKLLTSLFDISHSGQNRLHSKLDGDRLESYAKFVQVSGTL